MKKIISILLAFAMLVSLVPAAFAAETTSLENSGVKIVYDMCGTISELGMMALGEQFNLKSIGYDATGGFFKFVQGTDGTHYETSGNYLGSNNGSLAYYIQRGSARKPCFAFGGNTKVSFELNVPKAGLYSFDVDYYPDNTSGLTSSVAGGSSVFIYLNDNGVSTDSGCLIGQYKCYDENAASDADIVTYSIPGVEIEKAGNYTVTFTTNQANRWYRNNFCNFALNGGDSIIPMLSTCTITDDELELGEEAQITAEVKKLSDGSAATGVTYSYTSSENDVAEVDENGKVTAKSVGDTEITVTASCNGESISKVIPVSVILGNAAGIKLTYKFTGSDYAITWKEVATEKTKGFAKLTYDVSKDLNQYYTNNMNVTGHTSSQEFRGYGHEGFGMDCARSGSWYAATIRIPVSGKYVASVESTKYNQGSTLGVYLIKKNGELSVDELNAEINSSTFVGSHNCRDSSYPSLVWLEDPIKLKTVDVEAGEYYLVFKNTAGSSYAWFGDFHLDGFGEGTAPIITNCVAEKTALDVNDTSDIATSVRYITDGNSAEGVAYTYKSSDPEVAEVSADGTIIAKSAGNATITVSATATNATLPGTRKIDVTVTSNEDKAITEAFATTETVESYAPFVATYVYKDGESAKLENTASETYVTDNGNGTFSLSAPADADGYKFLYWVKGLSNSKRILGTSRDITYRATKDKSILVAVYENTADASKAKAEFYNANMQLIEANETFAIPELPVLAGFGKAVAWVADDMTEYTSGNAEIKKTGTTIFVAKYDDEISPEIMITATNATVDNGTPEYGDKITITADADSEGKVFRYFTKNGEIVCLDRTYSFNAYESCEVIAVYGASAPIYTGKRRKIFFDTFDVAGKTGLMAEFIGFGSYEVVEKGIMFGANKIPMTSGKTQFTIIADEEGTYKGYAIMKDGESYILIIDGEYTK